MTKIEDNFDTFETNQYYKYENSTDLFKKCTTTVSTELKSTYQPWIATIKLQSFHRSFRKITSVLYTEKLILNPVKSNQILIDLTKSRNNFSARINFLQLPMLKLFKFVRLEKYIFFHICLNFYIFIHIIE